MKYLMILLTSLFFMNCTNQSVENNEQTNVGAQEVAPSVPIKHGKKSGPIQIQFEKINDLQINVAITINADASDLTCQIHDFNKLQCNADETLLPKSAKKGDSITIPVRLDANHSIERLGVTVFGSFGSTKLSKGEVYTFVTNQKKESRDDDVIIEEDGRSVHILK